MKSTRKKRAMADPDRDTRDQHESRSSSNRELDRGQITPVSSTPERIGRGDMSDAEWARMSAGDPDVSRQGVETGEETPGGSTPTPDQDLVDEIGTAVGVTYQDNEPLTFGEKYAKRDEKRWEDDPASSEDYVERQAVVESDPPSPKKQIRRQPRSTRGRKSKQA
ncbi:MAG TPA: DUF6335 family protein [Nitrospiraceae bacterium]